LGERLPYKQDVGGSNPSSPTNKKPRQIPGFGLWRGFLFDFNKLKNLKTYLTKYNLLGIIKKLIFSGHCHRR
jgi:hypothetical protein